MTDTTTELTPAELAERVLTSGWLVEDPGYDTAFVATVRALATKVRDQHVGASSPQADDVDLTAGVIGLRGVRDRILALSKGRSGPTSLYADFAIDLNAALANIEPHRCPPAVALEGGDLAVSADCVTDVRRRLVEIGRPLSNQERIGLAAQLRDPEDALRARVTPAPSVATLSSSDDLLAVALSDRDRLAGMLGEVAHRLGLGQGPGAASDVEHRRAIATVRDWLDRPAPEGGDLAALAEQAWGVIANVSESRWEDQTPEWQDVATRWRDTWHDHLGIGPGGPPPYRQSPAPSVATPPLHDGESCEHADRENAALQAMINSSRAYAPAPAPLAVGDTVTTREQLAALPVGSVVRTDDDLIYERHLGWGWRGEQATVPLPCRVLDVGYPPAAEDGGA